MDGRNQSILLRMNICRTMAVAAFCLKTKEKDILTFESSSVRCLLYCASNKRKENTDAVPYVHVLCDSATAKFVYAWDGALFQVKSHVCVHA